MASGLTDFGASSWLSSLFGVSSAITGYYLALCTDEPGSDSDGTILTDLEPDDPSYARQAYGTGSGSWALNGVYLTNLAEIDFPTPSVDWGQIPYYALCTATVDGDLYAFGEFLSPQVVAAGDAVTIPVGGVVISLSALENSIAI